MTETFSLADSVKLRMFEKYKFQKYLDRTFRPIKTTVNKKTLKIEVTFYRCDTKAIQAVKMFMHNVLDEIDLLGRHHTELCAVSPQTFYLA